MQPTGEHTMIIPTRCFTCGKVIADQWDEFKERTEDGETPGDVLDDLGLERYCCRTVFITHNDLLPEIAQFKKD